MANIVSFTFHLQVSEQDAAAIRAEISNKLDRKPGRIFDPVILRSALYPGEPGHWATVDIMAHKEGLFSLYGQAKWSPPGWLGVWLAERSRAAVSLVFSEEDGDSEEWRLDLSDDEPGWKKVPEPEPEPEAWQSFNPIEPTDKWDQNP